MVTEGGFTEHDSPLGVEDVDRATVPANPLTALTVIVEPAETPAFTVTLDGPAVSVKSTKVKPALAAWVKDPTPPVIGRV